jgi:hypothetical protein
MTFFILTLGGLRYQDIDDERYHTSNRTTYGNQISYRRNRNMSCAGGSDWVQERGTHLWCSNIKLTADQQKSVDDLKAQIQSTLAKAVLTNAASALGGALGGKK